MGRKGVAQSMTAHRFDEVRLSCGSAHRALHYDLVPVRAPVCSGARIDRDLRCGKHPLPSPFLRGVGILPGQGVGQIHAAEAVGAVVVLQFPYSGEMSEQRRFHGEGQHREALFVPFAFSHHAVVGAAIYLFHPQPETLPQPQTGPVQGGVIGSGFVILIIFMQTLTVIHRQ